MEVRFMHAVLAARVAAILFPLCLPTLARAQTDAGEIIADRFSLSLGVYAQTGHRTQINLESIDLEIGGVVELEDDLNVQDSSGGVFRLDGYYRFKPAHRIDWTFYRTERKGYAELFDEHVDIGDLVDLRFGSTIDTTLEYGVFKLGYAWSCVNTAAWELTLGVGGNFYRDRVQITTRLYSGLEVDVREYREEGAGPLPTASFGARYKSGPWVWYWDYEVVEVEVGDFSGRLRESIIGVEHNTWEHLGFGLGLINSGDFVETADEGAEGEFDSEYEGWRFYLKTWF
jgi:hypothetical protein